jgi:hypothetical protein
MNRNRWRNLTTITDGRIIDPQGLVLKPPPYLEKPPSYCTDSPPPTYSSRPNFASDLLQNINSHQDATVVHPSAPPLIPPVDYSLCGDDCCSDSDCPGPLPPTDYSISGDESTTYRNFPGR